MTQESQLTRPEIDPVTDVIIMAFAALGTILIGPTSAAAPTGELWRQQTNLNIRPTLLPIQDALESHRRGLITDAEFRNILGRGGLSDAAISVYINLEDALFGPAELVALWRREEISDGIFDRELHKLGWSDDSIANLQKLAFDVPSGQDVIRFVVREVFNPGLRSQLGLDVDFPSDSIDAFKAAGLDEDRARNEWAAHWVLPGTALAFEMMHRGFIDEDDVRLILRANDVLPLFVDPIIAAAFNPLTRVDIRRMHAVGLLDEVQLVRSYQDVGFSPETAGLMAEFTILFNEAPDEEEAKETRDLTRAQIVAFMRADLFDEETAAQQLVDIGFSPDNASAIIQVELVAQLQKQRAAEIKVVRNRFQNGAIDFNEAVTELDALDLTARERDLLLTEMEAERLSQIKLATRGELDRFFRENIITRTEYMGELEALGYFEPWIERFAKLITDEFEEDAREPKKLSVAQSLRFMRAGLLTAAQALERLIELDFTEVDAGLFIELELLDKPEKDRDLPRSLIIQLLKAGIFEEDEARSRLLGLGFNAQDTDDILTLAQIVEPDDAV